MNEAITVGHLVAFLIGMPAGAALFMLIAIFKGY